MAFDQSTRNRLQTFVSDARELLVKEFTRQLQHDFGLDPAEGSVTPIENLDRLDDAHRQTAQILRETMAHYVATTPSGGKRDALERIVREQAFTVLNRLAALRMAEARDLLIESVSKGYNSKGFQLYAMLTSTGLGETGHAYQSYLFGLFDELGLDLTVMFDRFSPYGLLFPREVALLELLALLNDYEIAPLWAEDETIGWIYQHFNSKEERKKMREVTAPRNSRELAVRNQFFTPRYVVEFLTDNTLGRIWHEMTQGRTRLEDTCHYLLRRVNEIFLQAGQISPEEPLQDDLSNEQLLLQPVHIPHRALRDPREIRMLDPACGSMHFGLYAFDLFETIYEEAWEISWGKEELQKSGSSFVAFSSFVTQYPDKSSFLADVPRLIIEHNIHGIDIDPRATQIAGLSLWLRAQRSWQQQGLPSQSRPRIRQSNIVCAEPMPGEEPLLAEFIKTHLSTRPELNLLGQLVRRVFDAMKLAGEAGCLLKIEERITSAVAEAKQKWLEGPKPEQRQLFAYKAATAAQGNLALDVTGITDEAFWENAEERIYTALQEYAEKAEHIGGYQRRLFAGDVARGFAFIDLCRQRYDVVLMNPPFGPSSSGTVKYLAEAFPEAKHDLALCAVESGSALLKKDGSLGAIITRTPLFLPTSGEWRKNYLLGKASALSVLGDFGVGVLDATVESAAFVIHKLPPSKRRAALFVRAVDIEDKQTVLLNVLSEFTNGTLIQRGFFVALRDFDAIPFAPLSYWAPESARKVFQSFKPFRTARRDAKCGLGTLDDFRFLRLIWEVAPGTLSRSREWADYADGGSFTPYFESSSCVVRWLNEGKEVKAFVTQKVGSASRKVQGSRYYFNLGLTFPRRTKRFCPRALPANSIFSTAGQAIFLETANDTLAALGLLSSDVCKYLISLSLGTNSQDQGGTNPQFEVGLVKRLPWPDGLLETELPRLAEACTKEKMRYESYFEDSRYFVQPSTTCLSSSGISGHAELLSARGKALSADFRNVTNELNQIAARLYRLDQTDLSQIQGELGAKHDFDLNPLSEAKVCESIVSWLLGATFGRWNVQFAIHEDVVPHVLDPFAALPVCPPGMLQNEQGLPLTKGDVQRLRNTAHWDYPIEIPWAGIMVDDQGEPKDIEALIHKTLQTIWKERWEQVEHEACGILGVHTMRDYFRKPTRFFEDHLSSYSGSHRQAPIYWPLSTTSGTYTVWLYYPRLDEQTLYTCVNEFIDPKLERVNDTLAKLTAKGSGKSSKEEQDLERLHHLGLELEEFRDELLRLAKLPWKPSLNDGVRITAAPLWKLFRLPKWRKTLKETWEKLEKGDYDWAHLAYTLWPDRISEKCKTDKSLAIAHGLEELYVEPPASARMKRTRRPRVQETEEMEEA